MKIPMHKAMALRQILEEALHAGKRARERDEERSPPYRHAQQNQMWLQGWDAEDRRLKFRRT